MERAVRHSYRTVCLKQSIELYCLCACLCRQAEYNTFRRECEDFDHVDACGAWTNARQKLMSPSPVSGNVVVQGSLKHNGLQCP